MASKAEQENNRKQIYNFTSSLIRGHLKVAFISGVLFLLMGFYFFYQENFVYAKWTPVIATVTDVKTYSATDKDGRLSNYYDFSVAYTYNDEQKYDQRIKFSGTPSFKKGDGLPYLINPKNPEEKRANFQSAIPLFVVTFGGGIVLMLIGSPAYLKRKKK